MPNDIIGQVLHTSRKAEINIFDKKNTDKFSRRYLQSLTNNTRFYLNKEKHTNANREDVTRYLQSRGLINSVIRTNPEFIKFVNKHVPENRTGLTMSDKDRALKHLREVIRFDDKHFNKQITREDILEELRKSGHNPIKSKQLEDAIKAIIGRHNAGFTKKNLEKYRNGKNKYSLSFSALVWNEQEERQYVDERSIIFFSNLIQDQITEEIIEEIVEMYYADRDYPDFIKLIKWVLKLITHDSDIEDMELLDVICGKKYKNNYIRSYKDLVEGYDEQDPKHNGKCLNIMLQTNYKPLVDQRKVPHNVLTNKYIDDFLVKTAILNDCWSSSNISNMLRYTSLIKSVRSSLYLIRHKMESLLLLLHW